MADTQVSRFQQNILNFQYNPAAIQRTVYEALTDITEGKIEIVDPSSPMNFLMESAVVLTSASMIKNQVNNRRQYPIAAQTMEDLYPHMSDKDFIDRFATPSTTTIGIQMHEDELINLMVLDPSTGIRKLVFPRNTYFTVAGMNFSLQYPIEIRQYAHGGLRIVYDGSVPSPLQTLKSNVIDFETRPTNNGNWIYFNVAVSQFDIESKTGSLNSATDFKLTTVVTDQYYFTRVYLQNADGTWNEIRTTHTDQVYDVKVPTAVITVVDKNVTVRIPQVYTNTFIMNKSVRVDVYQTKGPKDLLLYEYPYSAFIVNWLAIDKNDNTIFTAPLKNIKSITMFSTDVVSGGSNEKSFETLRSQVINNSTGGVSLPVTNVQIESVLEKRGYAVVMNMDTITNRVFLATRAMPIPIDPKLITAANANMATLSFSINDIAMIQTVINNGASITITPETIYQNVKGITKLVTTPEVQFLKALTVEQRALQVTNGNYSYTPFHYVLDTTGNEFNVRPYYLDDPEIVTKLFVAENDTTLIQVSTKAYGIRRNTTGNVLEIITQSGEEYKTLDDDQVFVQLAYIPHGEKDRAYLNGVLIGRDEDNERIYSFDLATNFNVDANDNLQLTKFFMYTTEPKVTGAGLITEFDVIYSTSSVMGSQWQADNVDQVLGRFLLPSRIAGLTQEKLRVKFGAALSALWSRARSVISSVPYKTWPMNVLQVYETNQYQRDANGSAITFDVDGKPVLTLLHAKGDPVLDNNGVQLIKHYAGDVMFDEHGDPIPSDIRGMLRQVDIMLIEGAYWFATDNAAIQYRNDLTKSVVSWVTNDLALLSPDLLEQTRIYFYPKTTAGDIEVMIENGITKTIPAGQSFTVTLYVPAKVFDDSLMRDKLTSTTIQTLSKQLTAATVSTDLMEEALRVQYGADVISVRLEGLGGSLDLQALTILNGGDRCSIRKRLVPQADNSLIVSEDVTLVYIRHDTTL